MTDARTQGVVKSWGALYYPSALSLGALVQAAPQGCYLDFYPLPQCVRRC